MGLLQQTAASWLALALTLCVSALCWTMRVAKQRGLDGEDNAKDSRGSECLEGRGRRATLELERDNAQLPRASVNKKDGTSANFNEEPPRFPWQGSPIRLAESNSVVRKALPVSGMPGDHTAPSLSLPPRVGSTDASLLSSTRADQERQPQRTLESFMESMTFATGSGGFGSTPFMRPPSCPCCR
jgi:hypothetical protein